MNVEILMRPRRWAGRWTKQGYTVRIDRRLDRKERTEQGEMVRQAGMIGRQER